MTPMEQRRYDDACEALQMAICRACNYDPTNWIAFAYSGEPTGMAVWWAKCVMREARKLGLYPTTAQMAVEAREAA